MSRHVKSFTVGIFGNAPSVNFVIDGATTYPAIQLVKRPPA